MWLLISCPNMSDAVDLVLVVLEYEVVGLLMMEYLNLELLLLEHMN